MALSVSMEKRESPTPNESPGLMFHLRIFPSVIVGLTAGILHIDISTAKMSGEGMISLMIELTLLFLITVERARVAIAFGN